MVVNVNQVELEVDLDVFAPPDFQVKQFFVNKPFRYYSEITPNINFIGRLCEDRDPCYANGPCGNNGKCIATVDGNARCECNAGFSGPTCQISKIC